MAESVAYWSDNLSPDNNSALPPHAVGWAWPMGQPADPADLIQNADGSASATLTVPNNVSPLPASGTFCDNGDTGRRCNYRERGIPDPTGAQRLRRGNFHRKRLWNWI